MTDPAKRGRTLPLKRAPRSALVWLVALALGLPVTIMAFVLGSAWKEGAPAAPLLISGLFVCALSALVTLWIVRMTRRIAVTLDDDALTVATGVATQRFPLATLRAHGVRIVDLAAQPELKPVLRTASTMAWEGSAGVENTFSIRSWPCSTHTQSVKVPPVSTATRAGAGTRLRARAARLCRWPAIRKQPMYHQLLSAPQLPGPALPRAGQFASESQCEPCSITCTIPWPPSARWWPSL